MVKIDPNPNLIAIAKLTDTIHTGTRESIRRKAAFTLGKLLLEKPQINESNALLSLSIDTLVQTIALKTDPSNQLAALDKLRLYYN
jgi:hypothetical protein